MADGHDAPGLVSQAVPSLAAEGDDLVVGFEDAVGQPVVAHELPEVFDGVQFRGTRRQRQDGDVVGQTQLRRRVPAGLIDDENGMDAGIDGGADLGQMSIHRVGVAPRQDEPDGLAPCRTDSAEDVGPFGALVVRRTRPGSPLRPAPRDLVLLADTGLVLHEGLFVNRSVTFVSPPVSDDASLGPGLSNLAATAASPYMRSGP
jgi:hypothetical protein